MKEQHVNLGEIAASATEREGTIWALQTSEDLNANLVRFGAGAGVGEHVNSDVDVLIVGVSGVGLVGVDGEEHAVANGVVVLVPRGSLRYTRAVSDDFAYLSIHRRRGPLRIGG